MTSRKAGLLRWLVPVGAAVLLTAGTITISAVAASGDTTLTPRSAAQLLVDVDQARLGAISGTVVQTSDLGIPDLPGVGGGSSSDLTSLVSGRHTLRLWYDGTDKARVALLGTLGESDVIKNGTDLWTWSSRDNSATHRVLGPDKVGAGKQRGAASGGAPMGLDATQLPKTPQEAADALLAALDPSTSVTTDGTATVAGRPVYQLILQPRDTGSLISSVRIAIDAEKHVPLRVQVYAVDHPQPAFEVAFSAVDFSEPDAAQFTFNPPPGAQVDQIKPGTESANPKPDAGRTGAAPRPAAPKITGTGWTTVLTASASAVPTTGTLSRMLDALPKVSGGWGSGHLFSGTLFSAVLTNDGRIAIGAVAPELLYKALAAA